METRLCDGYAIYAEPLASTHDLSRSFVRRPRVPGLNVKHKTSGVPQIRRGAPRPSPASYR
jgi:hypothetical protein